jgi:sulfite reductase alpha subunit-like flavoprotein
MAQDQQAREIIQDLDEGGYIYVCGATAMGSDVNEALMYILKKHKNFSQERAVDFLQGLQKQGRYVQELWST